MKTKLFLALEEAISKVVDNNCEEGDGTGYVYPDLAKHMAKAAALVFDACMDGQEFADKA